MAGDEDMEHMIAMDEGSADLSGSAEDLDHTGASDILADRERASLRSKKGKAKRDFLEIIDPVELVVNIARVVASTVALPVNVFRQEKPLTNYGKQWGRLLKDNGVEIVLTSVGAALGAAVGGLVLDGGNLNQFNIAATGASGFFIWSLPTAVLASAGYWGGHAVNGAMNKNFTHRYWRRGGVLAGMLVSTMLSAFGNQYGDDYLNSIKWAATNPDDVIMKPIDGISDTLFPNFKNTRLDSFGLINIPFLSGAWELKDQGQCELKTRSIEEGFKVRGAQLIDTGEGRERVFQCLDRTGANYVPAQFGPEVRLELK